MMAFFRTVRYLQPHQIIARIGYKFKCHYYKTPLYPILEDWPETPEKIDLIPPQLWKGDSQKGEEITSNTFHFVGRYISMGKSTRWIPREASALWVYNLHYFEWLADLKALGKRGKEPARELIEDWLLQFKTFHPTVWHPYPLSLRIISWLTFSEWLLDGASKEFKHNFLQSLVQQIHHLEKVLEWDVGGNHLIKNIKAVIYGGLCIKGRQSHFLEALSLLLSEIDHQILPDGGHYERSPHYHADVLKDLIDIQSLIRKSGHQEPSKLKSTIDKMSTVLTFYQHGDGTLSLFNDGERGNPLTLQSILNRCHPNEYIPDHLPNTGYTRLQRGDSLLIMDTGLCCPDNLPAHAHADTLSFEFSYGNEQIFVNSGTYAYQHKLRNTFRGTAAHNTVVVDKTDSAEVYKTFRLGRRPRLVTSQISIPDTLGIEVSASHDGYKHLGVIHKRKIYMSEDGKTIYGEDILTGNKKRSVSAHFHLHPSTSYHMPEIGQMQIKSQGGKEFLFEVSDAKIYDAESHYSPKFGKMISNRQLIVIPSQKKWPICLKWSIKTL